MWKQKTRWDAILKRNISGDTRSLHIICSWTAKIRLTEVFNHFNRSRKLHAFCTWQSCHDTVGDTSNIKLTISAVLGSTWPSVNSYTERESRVRSTSTLAPLSPTLWNEVRSSNATAVARHRPAPVAFQTRCRFVSEWPELASQPPMMLCFDHHWSLKTFRFQTLFLLGAPARVGRLHGFSVVSA